jgi:hypothetical protein
MLANIGPFDPMNFPLFIIASPPKIAYHALNMVASVFWEKETTHNIRRNSLDHSLD